MGKKKDNVGKGMTWDETIMVMCMLVNGELYPTCVIFNTYFKENKPSDPCSLNPEVEVEPLTHTQACLQLGVVQVECKR